jgi:hypothetical protein
MELLKENFHDLSGFQFLPSKLLERNFEVLWTVDAVLRLLESHYCIKVNKMNWGSFSVKKNNFFSQMGNTTHSGKHRKSLEKRGFPGTGIPGKFSSLRM